MSSLAGPIDIAYADVRTLLTPASGFLRGYDFTLNPYSGCAFGCDYCYAASFAGTRRLSDTWGRWVLVKQNALALLRTHRGRLCDKTIYMSSVTDPYQPVEARLGLVRALLAELAHDQPRLVIQTRSPLVTRDIDVLRRFDTVQVNMTVTTDSEAVRRAFEPTCPPNDRRIAAIGEVARAGIRVAITMTPLLPVVDPAAFGRSLAETGAQTFVVQPLHPRRGRFAAGTRETARDARDAWPWDQDAYHAAVTVLREHLPGLHEGREGFSPV